MNLDWESLVRRYVWHAERTPYFTSLARLSPVQARYELFAYALLTGVAAGVLAFAALSARTPHGGAALVPLYAFSVACAALVLGATRHHLAALWCALAPLGALAYFAAYGFHPALGGGDRAFLVAIIAVWLAYGVRALAIARIAR